MTTVSRSMTSALTSLELDEIPVVTPDVDQSLDQALHELHQIVAPLWPLADYVAVNPCLGMNDKPFLIARQMLRNVRDCDLLMPRSYFQDLYHVGRIKPEDLSAAHRQCVSEYPDWYSHFDLTELIEWLSRPADSSTVDELRFRTVSEAVDQQQESSWSSHIINDITRHCSTHFDQGQALWSSPWEDASLYTAWREAAQLSQRMDLLGLPGFRAMVARLPADPKMAIKQLLSMLEIPPSHYSPFLICQAFSIAGWAAYVRYLVREKEVAGESSQDLIGLVAMRLAYDVALAKAPGIPWPLPLWPVDSDLDNGIAVPPRPTTDVLARHALQIATERVYREELFRKLATNTALPEVSTRKALQMVFCIDVRSEIMRRNLESVDRSIETYGFAGFFGLPLEYVPIGLDQGTPQCPVLLRPSILVHEHHHDGSEKSADDLAQKRVLGRKARKLWKTFQSSATSCFSFVESLGITYVGKLLIDSLHLDNPLALTHAADEQGSVPHESGLNLCNRQNQSLDTKQRIDLAEGMLRNLGLTSRFARIVALCGHASDVTNNPYRAALDCGACGGHSGEPNARVAAALLNDTRVRKGLETRGITIPPDTLFVAALHHTTSDRIELCDNQQVPPSHTEELALIESWWAEASKLSRAERCERLGTTDVLLRSRDWAEVRPEWGLAGNAAFIVAPRTRTMGLDLGGRTFMHSYDHRLDPELKVLELIMTAPMVVTNWINMQYYASAVDPVAFGSGNKVIHNVVGQFGVLQGNGGDLMTGLPWQSVHDGHNLQHEPQRLAVIIDAPRSSIQRIIEKHRLVRDLVTNGWIFLIAWEGETFFSWTTQGTWEQQFGTAQTTQPLT